MRRRKFMALVGATTVTSVAGCIGGDSGSGGNPGSVVEEFYEVASENQDDAEALQSEADPLLHSKSPIRGALQFFVAAQSSEDAETQQKNFDGVSVEVLNEDLSADEIKENFDVSMSDQINDDLIESVAGENAHVESTVDYEDGSSETDEWLVVKEDGDWVILI